MSIPESAPPLDGPTDNDVQKLRSWTGLLVVVGGDSAIALGAVLGVVAMNTPSTEAAGAAIVAVLSGAFTAISTMTTAYFGIRSMSNTAQSSIDAPRNGGPPRR
jgi:hypothetical protein